MALVLANRVQETTTTTGTGTITLAGAVAGFQSFAVIGNGNTTYYTITSGTAWEVGIGTYSTAGPTLARTTILSSSAGGAAITLAGTSAVFVTYPSDRAVTTDGTETLTNKTINGSNNTITNVSLTSAVTGTLPVANGGTGAVTLTTRGVLIGNGTSAVSATAAGITGQVLVGNTGADPSWATLTSTAVTSFSAGTTGLTPSTATQGAITLAGTLAVANGGTGVTTSTGTTSVVLSNSPTLVTPTLGAASATSIANGLGAVGTPSYTFTGDTNTGMWSPGADTIAFSEGGAEAMRINSSGNVGIGETSPGARLHVSGGTVGTTAGNLLNVTIDQGIAGTNAVGVRTNLVRVSSGTDWTTTAMRLQGRVDATDFGYIDFVSGGAQGLAFGSATSERMRIDSSGNVGIGTTAPLARLFVETPTSTGASFAYAANSNGAYPTGVFGGSFGYNFSAGGAEVDFWNGWTGATGNQGGFAFRRQTGASSQNLLMTIRGDGNVGIGTSSPLYQATVLGLGQNTAALTDAGNKGGSLYLQATGVTSGSGGAVLFGTTFGNQTPFAAIKGLVIDGSTNTIGELAFSTRNAIADTALTERLRINSSGNVGIGTSNPGYRLDIASGDTTAGLGYAMRIRSNATATAATLQFTNSAVTTQNGIIACSDTGAMTIQTDGASSLLAFRTNGNERFRILSTGGITSGDLADAVGYKGVPQNSQTASYTLALSDMGKHISITTGGVVIPANGSVAFPIGSTITVYNNSASAQNISITTDTLRLAGTATSGTRSLAQRGLATCIKVAATEWVVTGNVT